jgi:hypothetical protein
MHGVRRASLAVLLLAAVAVAVASHRPPPARGLETPPTEFSAARADEHLRWVASAPRPVGSVRLREVREQLLVQLTALGVAPEVQQAQVVVAKGPGRVTAASVVNVVARLPGTASQRSLLVVGHYDSVPSGPGAGDNGAAVAAMLETLRALRAGPAPVNDVLFLFTDAEEVGLLGAEGFLEHPLFEKVAVVLNFEARGSRGPSLLFETSDPDGWLVQRFAGVAPRPMGSSLASAVYRLMPNDTDLTVFRRAGRAVMNFAFIGGFIDYHTRRDSLEALDRDSLQHHGENMLALVRVLANEQVLPAEADASAIFFNAAGSALVRYPRSWAVPLALLLLAVEALGLRALLRAGKVRPGRVLLATGLTLAGALVAAALVLGVWLGLRTLTGLEAFPHHDAHEPGLFLAGLCSLGLAVFALSGRLGAGRFEDAEATLGARLPWVLLVLLSAVLLPGGSYLFAWPLLLTAPLTWPVANRDTWGAWLLRAVCGGGALLVTTSTLYPISLALGLTLAGAVVLLGFLLLGLLRPAISWLSGANWRAVSAAAAVAAVLVLTLGSVRVGASTERPWPDSLALWLDADRQRAWWLADSRVDGEWPLTVLGKTPTLGRFQEALPRVKKEVLSFEVSPPALAVPRVQRLSERKEGNARELTLRVEPSPGAVLTQVKIAAPVEVLGATVWSRPVPDKALSRGDSGFSLDLWQVPPEGVPLTLRLRADAPVQLHLRAVSLGVPPLPGGQKRPPELMAAPYGFGFTDSLIITKTEAL